MSEHQHIRADGTVTFLPHRLNRHTVVVRGLTADELWIFHGLSSGAGLLVGAPVLGVRYDRACADVRRSGRGPRRVHGRHPLPAQTWAARYLTIPAAVVADRHASSARSRLGGRSCADLALGLLVHL